MSDNDHWISVEDMLPPIRRSILLYSLMGGVAEGEREYDCWYQYRWSARLKKDEVTHWRYLPDSPERSEE